MDNGNSGSVSVKSGAATGGTGGSISVVVGAGDTNAGGRIVINAGLSTTSTGGSVSVSSGAAYHLWKFSNWITGRYFVWACDNLAYIL